MSQPASQLTHFEIHAPAGSTLPLGTPAVSPDGRTLVYTVIGSDQIPRLHVRVLDSIATRVLPGTEGRVHPFFSPDGRSIGFARTLEPLQLKRVELAGGSARVLAPLSGPWHGSSNQDGTILFIGQQTMQRVSEPVPLATTRGQRCATCARSRVPRRWTSAHAVRSSRFARQPAWPRGCQKATFNADDGWRPPSWTSQWRTYQCRPCRGIERGIVQPRARGGGLDAVQIQASIAEPLSTTPVSGIDGQTVLPPCLAQGSVASV